MSKKSNSGFSLIEVMLVASLLGGLGLVITSLTKQSTKSSAKYQYDSEVNLITNEINGILSDPAKCLATFSTTPVTNIKGKYYISTDLLAPANGYGNGGVKIASYSITVTGSDGVLKIAYENKNILKGSSGPSNIFRNINLFVVGTPGAITNCRSLSTSSVDIWSRGTGTHSNDIFYQGGNVGIGIASPATSLDIAGTLQATNFLYTSDARLKMNIQKIPNALSRALRLHGVMFDWKNKLNGVKDGYQIGLIAQEVEKVFPEAVFTNPDTGMKSVEYGNLVAPIIEALKAQQREIDELKKQLKNQCN